MNPFIHFIQEIWLSLRALFDSSLDLRLQRLRLLYYHDDSINLSFRRARDVVREHVREDYFPYYEQMLSAERAAYHARRDASTEAFPEMQALTRRIAGLIEQVQTLDSSLKNLPADNPQQAKIAEARRELIQAIEDALATQTAIPLGLLDLEVSAYQQPLKRATAQLDEISKRLSDTASAYDDLGQEPEYERVLREIEAEEARKQGKTSQGE